MVPSSPALAIVLVPATSSASSPLLSSVCGQPLLRYVLDEVAATGTRDVIVLALGDDDIVRNVEKSLDESVVVLRADDPESRARLASAAEKYQLNEVCLVLQGDLALITSQTLRLLTSLDPGVKCVRWVDTQATGVPAGAAGAATGDERPPCVALRVEVLLAAIASGGLMGLEHGALDGVGETRDIRSSHPAELMRVRDGVQRAVAEELLFGRIADEHRRAGAVVRSSARIDRTVVLANDAVVEHGAVLRGRTRVGPGTRIDVGCVLTDVEVGSRVYLKPYSVCTGASIGDATEIGPFSHLRPDTRLGSNVRIGNFVETKNMVVGDGAMANHLAFLGDGELGARANIGAGTIFCNSDGVNKFRTEVGAGAFVGSGCELVAPLKVGAGAFIATGTTVTAEVPADALAIGRAVAQIKPGYAKVLRARFAAIAARLGTSR